MTGAEPLRVAYVIGTYPSLTTTFIDREIEALRRRGVRISVITIRRPEGRLSPEQAAQGGSVRSVLPVPLVALIRSHLRFIRRRPRAYARAAIFLLSRPHPGARERVRTALHFGEAVHAATLIEELGPFDRIHAHFVDRAAVVALVAGRLLGIPYSATAHARDIFVSPVLLPEKASEATFVATCTGFNRAHLEATLGPAAASKLRCIHHGVDAARYAPNAGGPNGATPTILAVGQLREKKGFDDLVRACELLRARELAFSCDIVGEGPLERHLMMLARSLALGTTIRFSGALTHAEVIERYRTAAVFVLPSVTAADGDRDGIPNVVLEAMASGLPVVATRTSGIPEAVEEGGSGFLVPMHDPHALADRVETLLRDPVLRSRFGERGRALVAERFDVVANADRLLVEFRT